MIFLESPHQPYHNTKMKLSPLLKKIAALGCGLILILLLELALTFAGVSPLAHEDRFVGFDSSSRLFTETSPGQYSLNPVKAAYFNQQTFTMPKPPGVFRIVTLGGSTTYGRPYLQQTSFGTWLGKLIERYGFSKIEVINAGGISYASYRVQRVMQEMVDYQPDLMVVYSGHNEFLEARTFAEQKKESKVVGRLRGYLQYSRIYSTLARIIERGRGAGRTQTTLPEAVDATIEKIGGPELYHRDPVFRAGVIQQYQYELEEMARLSKQHGIPLVFCTLPVNLSGISPFKSEHRSGLLAPQLERWNTFVSAGEQYFKRGDYAEALISYRQASQIDDDYALLSYRTGQTLKALGQTREAYVAYDRAREEDIVPLRALNEFNDVVKKVAAAHKIPLADVEGFYQRISPGGIPGVNLFEDHVHPTVEGQQIIAWTILNTVTDKELVPLSATRWQQQMIKAKKYLQQAIEGLPISYLARGQWGVGRLYFWAGKYEEAYRPLSNAWKYVHDKPEIPSELGQIELSRGNNQKALEYFDAALALAPDNEDTVLKKAIALVFSGSSQAALSLMSEREWSTSNLASVWLTRGQALMILNQPQRGIVALRKAVNLASQVASFHLELSKGLVESGNRDEARREFRTYLELSKSPVIDQALAQWEQQFHASD